MKNSITALAAVIIWFLTACGDGDRIPKEYIDKQKMTAILVDMSVADAYGNDITQDNMRVPDSIRQEKVKVLYKQVLDLHKVDAKTFMTSYTYYENHPDRMKEVFEMVQADLTARKAKLGEPGSESAPLMHRLKIIFPYAEKAIAIPTNTDTVRPFVKRQP
ncbi:DUF4296 domain-containing protein [Chitinophaga sp. Mgbs1]|uniref:DUF4296 domain-containing protein n=1 Tax=Chitinophaga solisilvae TaxID=1233460 RepID=A0A433WIP2_9BACT|nr:DUF4296 domain-containing protein [Chitinophaga solisilvae]